MNHFPLPCLTSNKWRGFQLSTMEYFWRLQQHGWGIWTIPETEIYINSTVIRMGKPWWSTTELLFNQLNRSYMFLQFYSNSENEWLTQSSSSRFMVNLTFSRGIEDFMAILSSDPALGSPSSLQPQLLLGLAWRLGWASSSSHAALTATGTFEPSSAGLRKPCCGIGQIGNFSKQCALPLQSDLWRVGEPMVHFAAALESVDSFFQFAVRQIHIPRH